MPYGTQSFLSPAVNKFQSSLVVSLCQKRSVTICGKPTYVWSVYFVYDFYIYCFCLTRESLYKVKIPQLSHLQSTKLLPISQKENEKKILTKATWKPTLRHRPFISHLYFYLFSLEMLIILQTGTGIIKQASLINLKEITWRRNPSRVPSFPIAMAIWPM